MPQRDAVEALVTEHFERVYAMYEAFIEDAEESLELAEQTFRTVQYRNAVTPLELYEQVATTIRARRPAQALNGDVPSGAALCLLLREIAELDYDAVASVTGLPRPTVARYIAEARYKLIGGLTA